MTYIPIWTPFKAMNQAGRELNQDKLDVAYIAAVRDTLLCTLGLLALGIIGAWLGT